MKSKVKVIFLFWTNGLSTSHHILIVHCASSKDSFSADHSSSLHSGAFTWLRFSASLKVLVWARRWNVAKFIYRHHVADVSVFNFPMRPIFVKVLSKVFSVTNQRFWYKILSTKGGGGVITPQIRQKLFVKNIVHKGGKGGTPNSVKKIPQKIGILGPKTLFLVPFNVK